MDDVITAWTHCVGLVRPVHMRRYSSCKHHDLTGNELLFLAFCNISRPISKCYGVGTRPGQALGATDQISSW